MIIREAVPEDIDSILYVLKASLGETSSEKSADVWNYKHVSNPFGKSLVLVAEENDKLIGVRAFMRWKWQLGNKVYSAFRAVDTATHPEHQGKGVFKKLTLKAIEIAEESGDHFIFNTPNSQSKPGYLKMGWVEVGKLNVTLKPLFRFSKNKLESSHLIFENGIALSTLNKYHIEKVNERKIFTPKDSSYLNWRFKCCKLQDYWVFEDSGIFLAAYIKQRKFFKEFRIAEAIYTDHEGKNVINNKIKEIAKKVGASFISDSVGVLDFGISGSYGPDFTVRNLNLKNEETNSLHELNNWSYSLGDLELF